MLPFTNKTIETRDSDTDHHWTDHGIFQCSGIIDNSGKYYFLSSSNNAEKYGYRYFYFISHFLITILFYINLFCYFNRQGTAQEAQELGMEEKNNNNFLKVPSASLHRQVQNIKNSFKIFEFYYILYPYFPFDFFFRY